MNTYISVISIAIFLVNIVVAGKSKISSEINVNNQILLFKHDTLPKMYTKDTNKRKELNQKQNQDIKKDKNLPPLPPESEVPFIPINRFTPLLLGIAIILIFYFGRKKKNNK